MTDLTTNYHRMVNEALDNRDLTRAMALTREHIDALTIGRDNLQDRVKALEARLHPVGFQPLRSPDGLREGASIHVAGFGCGVLRATAIYDARSETYFCDVEWAFGRRSGVRLPVSDLVGGFVGYRP